MYKADISTASARSFPDRLASMAYSHTGATQSFTHDALGRMTSDGQNGLQIAYNALDLPRKVSSSGTTLVNYSYLADGTRTAALKPDGSGLVQRGSLTYRRGTDGSLGFEGADITGGRFTAGQVIWHVTDHLGSVVGILRSGGANPFEYNVFNAFGTKTRTQFSAPFTPEASLRFAFTGKEDQTTEFNIPYTDFGARHYSPALTRWLTPDPLSEKYYGISPYAYCGGDPVNRIDSDGRVDWKLVEKGASGFGFGVIGMIGVAAIATASAGSASPALVPITVTAASSIGLGASLMIVGFTSEPSPETEEVLENYPMNPTEAITKSVDNMLGNENHEVENAAKLLSIPFMASLSGPAIPSTPIQALSKAAKISKAMNDVSTIVQNVANNSTVSSTGSDSSKSSNQKTQSSADSDAPSKQIDTNTQLPLREEYYWKPK